jgi:hypothetical protein
MPSGNAFRVCYIHLEEANVIPAQFIDRCAAILLIPAGEKRHVTGFSQLPADFKAYPAVGPRHKCNTIIHPLFYEKFWFTLITLFQK